MKRIITRIAVIFFIISYQITFAAGGNFFNVSSVGSAITINTTIPNHVYSSIGLQINTAGYSFSSTPGSECQEGNTHCVFPMSREIAQTIAVNGPSGQMQMTLCLNGVGPTSCQKYTVSIHPLHLAFNVQPSNTTPMGTTGGTISPSVTVNVLDENNQLYTDASIPVTLSIAHQPNTGIYQGLLGGTTTVSSVAGVATFSNLNVSQIGTGYTLAASATGVTGATSSSFNITGSTAGYISQDDVTEGFEITYTGDLGAAYQGIMSVYIDYGDNPIDSSEFASFSEPNYLKNSPRNPIFNYTNTLGSPNTIPGSLTISTIGGYTWGEIAQIQNFDWPFNPNNYPDPQPSSGWQAGAASPTVPAGVVKYSNINKNQLAIYTRLDAHDTPILRYFVTDPWGNVFMMDATNAENDTVDKTTAAFEAAQLPSGWTKSMAYLTQDLYVNPAYNNYNASILKFRDSADNSYIQLMWGASGDSIAQQIGSPMPLWAGPGGARVNGTSGNDTMYGSSGDDQFYSGDGSDTINGGSGYNGVYLDHPFTAYTISQSGNTTYLTRGSEVKTLTNIQYLHFSDGSMIQLPLL